MFGSWEIELQIVLWNFNLKIMESSPITLLRYLEFQVDLIAFPSKITMIYWRCSWSGDMTHLKRSLLSLSLKNSCLDSMQVSFVYDLFHFDFIAINDFLKCFKYTPVDQCQFLWVANLTRTTNQSIDLNI